MAKEQRSTWMRYDLRGTPGLTGTLKLTSWEAYRTLGHPLRSSIFGLLGRPRSAKEVAAELDVPVARLYHHIKLLEKNGLIAVVDERRAGSNAERVYRIAAAQIEIAGTIDWDENLRETSTRLAEAHRRFSEAVELATKSRLEADRSQGDPLLDPWLVEVVDELDDEQALRVVNRFREVVRELQAEIEERPKRPKKGTRRYGLQLTFTPFPDGKERRWIEFSHETFDPT